MLSVEQAEQIILDLVQPFDPDRDTETLDLLDAIGRILAQPVTSDLDFPHWDNSAMDGYAVRYADVQGCDAASIDLEIVEEIPAGYQPQQVIQSGQSRADFDWLGHAHGRRYGGDAGKHGAIGRSGHDPGGS